jgi:hypothetical protein
VLVVGDGIDEAEDVLAALGIEAVEENGVGGAFFAGQLEFGIAYDDFAFVVNAKSVPTCKTIFISSLAAMAPPGRWMLFGCS